MRRHQASLAELLRRGLRAGAPCRRPARPLGLCVLPDPLGGSRVQRGRDCAAAPPGTRLLARIRGRTGPRGRRHGRAYPHRLQPAHGVRCAYPTRGENGQGNARPPRQPDRDARLVRVSRADGQRGASGQEVHGRTRAGPRGGGQAPAAVRLTHRGCDRTSAVRRTGNRRPGACPVEHPRVDRGRAGESEGGARSHCRDPAGRPDPRRRRLGDLAVPSGVVMAARGSQPRPALLVAANLAVDAVTAEVVAALRADGVGSLLLRGPAISTWLYSEETESPRTYDDLDLLVTPDQEERCAAVLTGLGFYNRSWAFAPGETVEHASEWHRSESRIAVDLHRGLFGVKTD